MIIIDKNHHLQFNATAIKGKLVPYPNLLIHPLTQKIFIWGQELGQILKIN